MRNRHYTPQLPRSQVSLLYHLARARRQPMTRLVAEIVDDYLAAHGIRHVSDVGHAELGSTPPASAAPYDSQASRAA